MKKSLFLLAVASAFSVSAVAADRQFDAFMGRVVGNQTTVTFGGGGQPMVTSSSHLGTPNTVGSMAVYGNGSGVGIEGRANMPVAGTSKTVPVDVKAPISKANFGKALIFAGRASWPIGVVLTAGDIYEYLKGLNLQDIKNTPNGITAKKITDFVGFEFSLEIEKIWGGTPHAACATFSTSMRGFPPVDSYGNGYTGFFPQARNDDGYWKCYVSTNFSSNGQTIYTKDRFVIPILSRGNNGASSEFLTETEILDTIAQQSGWPTSSARALAEALRVPGVAPVVAPETPNIVGPFAVPSTKTTTNETVKVIPGTTTVAPPGTSVTEPATRTTTSQTTHNITYNQNTATTTNTTTSTTNITNNITNQTSNEGDPVTETEEKPEIEVCGLPGTPACKIDETGTPEAKPDTAEADAKKALKPLDDLIANPQSALPTLPTINWAFTLPSGCAPIALPAFEPWLQEIDVCAFQPMFHDIMTFVWVLGGIFGAIGTFWRNTFSQG